MAYFEDLSVYEYHHGAFYVPGTVNVGWLSKERDFRVSEPSPELVSGLWRLCGTSVAQMRGLHFCDLCEPDAQLQSAIGRFAEEKLLLGAAEIRAFGREGAIYAAPTLVYHYIVAHKYAPPEVFVDAVLNGPKPPDESYYAKLRTLGLEWNATSVPPDVLTYFRAK